MATERELTRCRCGYPIYDDDVVKITGIAHVEGETTIPGFFRDGVEWAETESSDEGWICPKCGRENPIPWERRGY